MLKKLSETFNRRQDGHSRCRAMRHLLVYTFATLLTSPVMVVLMQGYGRADLGGADITDSSGNTTGATYSARCGKAAYKCNVSFKDGRLVVDNGFGILSNQVVTITTSRTCRQKSVIMPWLKSCFESQYDHDFTISYRSSDGSEKSALIAFRPGYFHQGEEAYNSFNRDLQVWLKRTLRPIGPNVELEIGPAR